MSVEHEQTLAELAKAMVEACRLPAGEDRSKAIAVLVEAIQKTVNPSIIYDSYLNCFGASGIPPGKNILGQPFKND